MRRPAAPHLRPGRPGAPAPTAPIAPTTTPPSAASPAPATAHPVSPPRTGRRAVLLGGAAAAVGGTVLTGALLRTGGPAAPSVASSSGSGPGDASPAGPFTDVPADHPAAEAIRWAHETGVQPAPSATEYSPQEIATRGDVIVALHRLAGTPPVDLSGLPMLFTDLGEDPARIAAAAWLHGRGALWGDAELRVHLEDPATRDCTAGMLTALMRPALAGVGVTWDTSAGSSPPTVEGPDSALADVAWLEAAGMAAVAPTDWVGGETVTRGDLAVSLHRVDAVITAALE